MQKIGLSLDITVSHKTICTYQAFAHYSDAHVRSLNLTSPQFDVIAPLGGTNGMSMKQVADKTLVTKGTLTGIIDRL